MKVLYSRGTNKFDALPELREADSFDEFREAVLADCGQRKGQQWIATPFSISDENHCAKYDKAVLGLPHRSGESALPRRWLGLDADGCTPEEFVRLQDKLQGYKALVYTTASHTEQAPRFRIIIELAYALDRTVLKIVSSAVRAELSSDILWDEACDRAEQPLYLPIAGCTHWKFDGCALRPWNFLPPTDLVAIDLRNRKLEEISATAPGARNDVLNKCAFILGGLVGAGRLELADTERLLVEATRGWSNPTKTRSTIRSAMRRGAQQPLEWGASSIATVARGESAQAHPTLNPLSPLSSLSPLSPLSQSEVIIQRGDQLTPEPIDWLWHGWIARGKIHISAGAAGTGKTTTACALAATITRGGSWPDGTYAKQGSVLMWSGEDDVKNVLVPRFRGCNADMSKVHFVTGVSERGKEYSFDPSKDLSLLEDQLRQRPDIALIIVDPIVSVVGGDSHKNTETRRALQPLVDLASKFNCALIGITHLSKGTQGRDANERVAGSLAFVALARVVFMSAATEPKEGEPQRRIFIRSKSNLGPNTGGFEYSLEFPELAGFPGVTGSKVVWGAAVDGSARCLLTQMESAEAPNSARSDARTWLLDRLAAGPVPQKQIRSEAIAEGHSWATLRRAKDDINVKAQKLASGAWVWRLPLPIPPRPLPLAGAESAQGTQGAQGARPQPLPPLSLPPLPSERR